MSSKERPILANRDYPYHDHIKIDDGSEPDLWVVGSTNVGLNGSQRKVFVSKSLLAYSDVACTFRFNHRNNVTINHPANAFIEYKSNIWSVHVLTIATDGSLYLWADGVLPEDARGTE